jgi:hypothetical protein
MYLNKLRKIIILAVEDKIIVKINFYLNLSTSPQTPPPVW